jgi:hypothetical protein
VHSHCCAALGERFDGVDQGALLLLGGGHPITMYIVRGTLAAMLAAKSVSIVSRNVQSRARSTSQSNFKEARTAGALILGVHRGASKNAGR